ncbi:transport and Golgi organization protein 1 homolog [Tupaia chinensis]|uniref:transport and Golgi organization protein 1 homolog n=1 Tax=Tupaia chinensis TaxID=246437 RepID=UPI0003C8DFE0|nr:transport and Golgi organization protein 1 homolog [Tupaia chinensis]
MLGGSGMDIPPWGADMGACAVCMKNSSSIPPEDQDKGKVKADFIFLQMHLLCDDFHLGPNCFGNFWKPVIIAAYLGISAVVIFIWRIIFPEAIYEMT